jgi:autotransporter translocation and assembly factor TamB
MVRRSLAAVLWLVAGLLASFLGALSALVGTGAGHALLARVARGAFEQVVEGSVEIGDIGGPLLTGVTLRDVRLFDRDTTLVAVLPRLDASYNPFDFVAGRVVLLGLDLRQPVVNVVQHKSGRLNVEELLRLGGPPAPAAKPAGPATLILFRNVRIENGAVTLRLQDGNSTAGPGLEIDPLEGDGRWRIRRFEHLNARLAALRISSPQERGVRIDILQLAVQGSDPAVQITNAAGRITIVGDSLHADLRRVDLPGSRFSAVGTIQWPRDTLLFDLTLAADSATLGDVAFVVPRFPPAAVLRGGVRVLSHGGRLLEVGLDPLDLRYGGGTLTGRLTAITRPDTGLIAVRRADLTAKEFDLDFPRAFVPALPFFGRLSGRTTADGRLDSLALDVDWAFRDSLVAGLPETEVRGSGVVNLLAPEDIIFQAFTVAQAAVDLGTVRGLVPAMALRGTLDAVGTVTGPLHNAQFAGTLVHHDGERPASTLTGTMRLDNRTDTLGVYADVRAESLSFDGLRGSFPGLRLRGTVAGNIRLAGSLAALDTHAALQSAGGAVQLDGALTLLPPRWGARDVSVRATELDLASWVSGAPDSRLSFSVAGAMTRDSAAPPVGAVRVALAPSVLVGASLDSGAATVEFTGGRLVVDSLRLAQPGLVTTGAGALGWERPARGVLSFDFDADSLNALDSLVAWLAGPDIVAERHGRALRGAARLLLTLDGALDSLAIDARASGERLAWRDWQIPEGHAHVVYQPGPVPLIRVDGTLDSLRHGEYAFGGVSAAVSGRRDSLSWFGRFRFGELGALLAGGRLARRPPGTDLAVDSLAVLLPGGVWLLQAPATVAVNDSVIDVGAVTLRSASDSGLLVLQGSFPARGRADAHLQIEGFPLAGVYSLLEQDTTGVGGTITATIGLSGTRADPIYTGSLALKNGALGDFRAPYVDGTLGYSDRRLDAALHLWRSGQQILTVTAHLPLDLSLVAVKQRELPDTLSVNARADSVNLSVLEALTTLFREVEGVFSADVGIAGTWDNPRLRGGLRISGAAATIPALNVRYRDVTGDLTLSGDTVAVRTLSAKSDKGSMDVSGYMRLEELTRPVLALSIVADRFKALDLRGNVTGTVSGRLALTGPVFGATLTGRATVTSGVLYFADLIEKRIVSLEGLADTSLASIIQQQRLGPEFESVFLDSLRIRDLDLDMGSDVWLRSNEANIQLAGRVSLSKERNNYLLSGTLQAPRGVYRLKVGITREFVVSQGTVRYFGTPDLDAELNIEAKHTVHTVPTASQGSEDIAIVAHITGTLLVPHVTLEAERRDLSETEVISYLLFGKPSFELTGGQGGVADQRALLHSAVSVLSGELERTLVSDLGIPLDYVEIRPGAPTDPFAGVQLAVGRQLGRKTFLVVNAGFSQGCPVAVSNTIGLSLQFRISPEFRTEASFEPVRVCTADPLSAAPTTSGLRQVGFDLIWERRY